MGIPKITKTDVLNALEFIDRNGVPDHNTSTKYNLVSTEGKKYPPKYVVAVADHIANGSKIKTDGFISTEANRYLEGLGFIIETVQTKFELRITADRITSTDTRFSTASISNGDHYKPLDVYLQRQNGERIKRSYDKGERRNSNQTLPRIACQVFEKQLVSLSREEKENFPVCQYTPSSDVICGIFSSVDEFKKHKNTIEYLTYGYDNGRQFVIYCWNIFSTLLFVQECLKRFGAPGDCFVLTYREKEEKEAVSEQVQKDKAASEELVQQFSGYRNPYSKKLIESKNIIFRGAPGTGKTYLAKEIATDIISNGYFDDYTLLSNEQKQQIEFVQFHPSYDYSDFVEGLRPKVNADGSMGFELQDGIFKRFVERARKNLENSQKSLELIKREASVQEAITDFFANIELGVDPFKTTNGSDFFVTAVDDQHIRIAIPGNNSSNTLSLNMSVLHQLLESENKIDRVKDIWPVCGRSYGTQDDSYYFALFRAMQKNTKKRTKTIVKQEALKKYVFIIDEINRGEISKIFGELFFAIDPGYRGHAGEVSTQYANLHPNPNNKFYIPENVYIIGTMNDIDRSVDSFDFAMRRRFRFIELKADERLEMLSLLEDEALEAEAIRRMTALNQEILRVDELNENYQIGASYFLKLNTLTFDQLWTDYLQPLLREYVQGMYDEDGIMKKFAKAYGYSLPDEGSSHEAFED